MTKLKTDSHGYVAKNGLEMYYEIHGTGQPLVLLHGARFRLSVDSQLAILPGTSHVSLVHRADALDCPRLPPHTDAACGFEWSLKGWA